MRLTTCFAHAPVALAFLFVHPKSLVAQDVPTQAESQPGEKSRVSKAKPHPSLKSSTKRQRGKLRPKDNPPPCLVAVQTTQPPAQSMPELFQRLGESFTRNPATGFQTFLGELSRLEEPAVSGIRVSIDEERRVGRRAREEYIAKATSLGYRIVNDPKRLAYLNALVKRFSTRMQHRDRYPEIEVGLIEAPVSDGQSFPGGFLLFTTELLREPDEATVAGVVAHELAHLDCGHFYSYVCAQN